MNKDIGNQRTNVIDHKQYDKSLLVRIAILKDGKTILNSKEGRGIYFKESTLINARDLKTLKHYINKKKGNFSEIENIIKKIIDERGESHGNKGKK